MLAPVDQAPLPPGVLRKGTPQETAREVILIVLGGAYSAVFYFAIGMLIWRAWPF